MAQPPTAVYALLADGTTVEIRPAVPADFDAVKAMHEAMSRDNSYLRFFNVSRHSAEIEARRICRNSKPGSAALLAVANGEVVGVASYVPPGDDPQHGRGGVRRGRPHASQGHRDPAARAPGLAGQEPPDHHVHGRDAVRQPGRRWCVRRRRPARPTALRRRASSSWPSRCPARTARTAYSYLDAVAERERQRGRGQPAAHLRARVGRGDRREPAPRHGGPGHPGQHQGRRVRRTDLRREPARCPGRRRADPGLTRSTCPSRPTWR